MLEDRYLIWRLKRGNPQALCRIYNRYESDLLTLATSLVGRSGYAPDVLQDVFVKFLESIDTFELTGSLKGYLAKCVVNRARDYLRRDRGRRTEDSQLPSEDRHPDRGLEGLPNAELCVRDPGPSPVETAIADEQRQSLIAALAELPDEQQEAVLLHLQAGLKFREIASVQGVSAKTAESRYRYGLDRLRSMLNRQVET